MQQIRRHVICPVSCRGLVPILTVCFESVKGLAMSAKFCVAVRPVTATVERKYSAVCALWHVYGPQLRL